MKIARVSENGRTWLWRYDWPKSAIERENIRCKKYKVINVLSKLTILHIYDDGH